jgi:hypothetical protein
MIEDLFEPVDCSDPQNQKEIDEAIERYSDYHRIYVCLGNKPKWRNQIAERWKVVRDFCEPNFASEFKRTNGFYGRLWELNLRYLFRQHLALRPGRGEPDLIARDWLMECGVPEPIGVPRAVFDGMLYDYPTEEIALRVSNTLEEKLKQLNRRRAKSSRISYSKTPYIVAIGLPPDDFRDATAPSGVSIVEAVAMGTWGLQMRLDSSGRGVIEASTKGTLTSPKGTVFPVAYFQRPEYANVSAVLYSRELIPNIDDLEILLNPNAISPLDPNILGLAKNTITYTRTSSGYRRDQPL